MTFTERRFIKRLPAVMMNDIVIDKGGEVTPDEIESAVLREMCKAEHLP